MQRPNLAHDPNHSHHDASLIAGHAAGDLADSELARAVALVDACGHCADLQRDLVAIAAATHALPNLATAPRDFRLDADQAARLSRGSWLRAALRPFAAARSGTRPMAAAFTSLGLAGLLVTTVLPSLLGGATAGAPGREQAAGNEQATSAPVAAPVVVGNGAGQTAGPPPDRAGTGTDMGSLATGDPSEYYGVKDGSPEPSDGAVAVAGGPQTPTTDGQPEGGRSDASEQVAGTAPPNLLLVGSLALLAIGLLLFGLRLAARRVT